MSARDYTKQEFENVVTKHLPKEGKDALSPFMKFWKISNDILRSRQQHEMLYGEARNYWDELMNWKA